MAAPIRPYLVVLPLLLLVSACSGASSPVSPSAMLGTDHSPDVASVSGIWAGPAVDSSGTVMGSGMGGPMSRPSGRSSRPAR